MKKLSAILAAALLAMALAVTVSAAEVVTVSMSAEEAKLGADTVTVTVSTDRAFEAKSLYIGEFDYDKSLLELASGRWLADGAVLSDFDLSGADGTGIGILTFDSNQSVSDDIFELTFAVKADCPTSLPIYFSFEATTKAEGGKEVPLEGLNVAPGQVSFTEDTVYLGMEQKTVDAADGTFTVDLWIAQPAEFRTIRIAPAIDIPGLELVGGEWLIDGADKIEWSGITPTAELSFDANTEVSGPIFRYTYRILDSAYGDIEIDPGTIQILKYSEWMGDEYARLIDAGWGSVTVNRTLRGDVNGDSIVNSDDAIYLLRHTMRPDGYPINQDGDMNGNGTIDSSDAIYLLRHAMRPDRYPLAQ